MKKIFSKLAAVLCAAMLLVAVGVFAGCGAKEPTTFTITVKTPDGSYDSALSEVLSIGICEGDEGSCRMFELDENGLCTIKESELNPEYKGEYVVKILGNGEDLIYNTYNDDHASHPISKENNSITITLTLKNS